MFIENKTVPIVEIGKIIDQKLTDNIIKYFQNNLLWEQDEYVLYGKKVKAPRLSVFYGEKPYTYSGKTKFPNEWDKGLLYIKKIIEDKLNISNYFNGCLVNLYKDGLDYMGYHKDNESEIEKDSIIAIFSVGTDRKFYIKNDNTSEVIKYLSSNCSLIVMNPICQKEWKHSIPKETKIKDIRISLTFRRFN